MSELLFECYQVPLECYGLDILFSYYYNLMENSMFNYQTKKSAFGLEDGLIISSGFTSTYVLPYQKSIHLK